LKFISILTDFGLKDGYVGVMKGVILGIAPGTQIADISHTIRPQNVFEGALALHRAAPYFPAGTVHIAVVDPGVGTQRRALAARLGDFFFVAPDNGLLTLVLAECERSGKIIEIVQLDQPQYWLKNVSNVFHGRDIFAPVAAHLANGVPLSQLGTRITDPVRISIPTPAPIKNGWQGQVIFIDNFGSLLTNIDLSHLQNHTGLRVQVSGIEIQGLVRTFGDRPVGEMIALYGTQNDLTVAKVNGSAAQHLGTQIGDPVTVLFDPAAA
jgi:S-adenosyl-L-methionine hydrolase (adenosine-forming)